jgi:hypothetical protein
MRGLLQNARALNFMVKMARQEAGVNPLPGELKTIAPWYPKVLAALRWSIIILLIMTVGLILGVGSLGPQLLLVAAGVALIMQAVRFYLKVKYEYALQDRLDTKDQAVGSSVDVRRSTQEDGDHSEAIAARYPVQNNSNPLGGSVTGAARVLYLPPKYLAKGDKRAVEKEVLLARAAAGSES